MGFKEFKNRNVNFSSRWRSHQGFTLVEIMCAVALVTLITLALLGAQVAARTSARKAMLHLEATNVVQSALEQQKALPFANIQSLGAQNVVISDNGSQADLTDDVNGILQVNVVDNGNTKVINTTVSWDHIYFGAMQNSNVTLTTIVADIAG